ncbi:hypothetical protein EXU30_16160 [Shewanella maritima]|uniref:MmcQ/YjbR family DNA-binding protein n=2 Tax=Shewanella maritima TaxID=2520507 RepID=A0A411PKJ1_9GAMM|nr:hypothetical protein EXU30_16160 [Shewanella maritima]
MGYMDKKHWISIYFDSKPVDMLTTTKLGAVPQGEVERLVDSSFELVVSKLTKKDQTSIRNQM